VSYMNSIHITQFRFLELGRDKVYYHRSMSVYRRKCREYDNEQHNCFRLNIIRNFLRKKRNNANLRQGRIRKYHKIT
jgi:hypothetical protein